MSINEEPLKPGDYGDIISPEKSVPAGVMISLDNDNISTRLSYLDKNSSIDLGQ